MQENFSLINKTRSKLPLLPFLKMKNDILGKDYVLSIAFVNEKTSKALNNKYRKRNKPTNILSFLLHKKEGEIVLCHAVVRKEAKNFNKTFSQFLGFLVIHGMLHLKGLDHGKKMEKEEKKYLSRKYFA